MAKKKTRVNGKAAIQSQLSDLLAMAAQEFRNMQARSAGITFRVPHSEMRAHFEQRAEFWDAYGDGIEDGSEETPLYDDCLPPMPGQPVIDAEFETAAKENEARLKKMRERHQKALVKHARDRSTSFQFMADHLEDQPFFVVDAQIAEAFELAPAFGYGRQLVGRI